MTRGLGRTRRHGHVRQSEDPLRLPPAAHLGEGIAADREHGSRPGVTRAQGLQRIHQEGGARPIDLDRIALEARVVADRQFHPGQPISGWCDHVVAPLVLVGRPSTRHEDHALETELLDDLLGRSKVCLMDRVERTAVDADHPRS